MKRGCSIPILFLVSLSLILAAVILTTLEINAYRRELTYYPEGTIIAGISVGGLDHQQAAERLLQVFSQPVEAHYNQAIFRIEPASVGFQIDIEAMLADADQQQVRLPFWQGFWDYLWNKAQPPFSVPLEASIDEDKLRSFLKSEIETRYDRPPTPAFPVAGTTRFSPGQPGTILDLDRAVESIGKALLSPNRPTVTLTYSQVVPPRPSFVNLQVLLQQIIQIEQYTGTAEVYLTDLQTSENIHFVYQYRMEEPLPLDIAFSGWSTIKIPIMVSAFARLSEPTPTSSMTLLRDMITLSDNTAADRLAQSIIDPDLAPILVTQDMQALGLNDTFWAGYFYPGAPLLRRYTTPANRRTDVNTGPDPYDETTPADLGALLEDIYQCSQTGGGTLPAVFPGKISQGECKEMITLLTGNDMPQLIQAGLPYGTPWAHKHGWANEYPDGLIHTMGDAGIAFTPGGNFVIVVFVYHPVQVVFDPTSALVAHLGTAAYNFFNPPYPQ